MTTSTLHQLQAQFAPAIDREILDWLTGGPSAPYYSMMRYQLGYADADGRPRPPSGGKRFRPLLCLLACEGSGRAWQDALPLAASIELLHNFSLIHDDIEDRDPSRHHRPTVWKVWGEAQAINVGDGMFALAGRALLAVEAEPEVARNLARAFQETSQALTEGQYLDLSFESQGHVSAEDYLHMIELKTGALVAYSVWSGAYLAGAADDSSEALRRFGLELGKAFQIRDDVRGIWAPPAVTGKAAAKDLENRKKTLPILLAAEGASGRDQEVLQRYLAKESDDLAPVLAVLEATNARRRTEERARAYLAAALAALGDAEIAPAQQADLVALARELTA